MDISTEQGTAVEVRRTDRSQVLVGDGSVAVRIQPGGGTGLESTPGLLDALDLRVLPPLRARAGGRRIQPAGRDALLAAAFADLEDGRQVQLVGAAGAGRAAVALALVDQAAGLSRPGAVLLGDGGSAPHTLESLYTRLAGLFFDVRWHRPDEAALRTVTGRLAPAGLIAVTDFELPAGDAERLLGTFPGCRFLVTSASSTLGDRAALHPVPALTADDAVAIVRGAFGRELNEAERAQAVAAHALAGGRAVALVTSAAFLRRAAGDPRQTGFLAVPPERQAALLIAGLDEPSRRILAAIAYFGPAPAALFPLLASGREPAEPADIVAMLEYSGLITVSDDGYRATAQATQAVFGGAAVPDMPGIAERLCAAYALDRAPAALPSPLPAPPPPPPAPFALEVVRALVNARDWDVACRLARAAATAAASAGRMGPWSELVAFGAQAARESGRREDLRYFLHEQHTDALLRNDTAAAAALLLALSALLRTPIPVPSPPTGPRAPRGPARRVLRAGRRAATAGHGAGGVAALVVAATVAGAVFGASRHPAPSASDGNASATAASSWTSAAPPAAPTWTVALSGNSLSPLPSGSGTVTAQFPSISGGVTNSAERSSLDTALQQPIIAGVTDTRKLDQALAAAGLNTFSTTDAIMTETTKVTQTGDLLSVVYDYGAAGGSPGLPGATALVVRKDTGTVIPQQGILTAATTTPAGADRLDALVDSLLPAPAQSGQTNGGMQEPPLVVGCEMSYGNTFVSTAVAVGPSGLTFYVGDTVQGACAGSVPVTVPFARLSGLVNPLIVQLAEVGGSIR